MASITASGTCVPAGPSRKARARPSTIRPKAGKSRRARSQSAAVNGIVAELKLVVPAHPRRPGYLGRWARCYLQVQPPGALEAGPVIDASRRRRNDRAGLAAVVL